jgi:hypothetical protein
MGARLETEFFAPSRTNCGGQAMKQDQLRFGLYALPRLSALTRKQTNPYPRKVIEALLR